MTYAKKYITKKVYQKGIAKSGAYTYLAGVWVMVRDMARYLSRETYEDTWSGLLTHPDYQVAFGDLSDEKLIEYFENLIETSQYKKYIKMEDLEIFGQELPSPKGSEDCITSAEWVNQELELAA